MSTQKDRKSLSSEEEKELKHLEALHLADKKADEDYAAQQKQLSDIRNVGGYYSLLSRTWAFIASIIKITGHSIGVVAQIIPPINAMVGGITSILEIVEALFISRETMNRRAIKVFNGTVSTGLSITALVLAFNPATAPLGIALSAGAIAVSTAKDAFFWYKANKDLNKAKKELELTESTVNKKIHDIVYKEHKTNIDQLKEINKQIISLEKNSPALIDLQQKKNIIIHTIDEAVNTRLDILTARNRIKKLKNQVTQFTAVRNEKRTSFFYSALSLIGVSLAAVAAFAVVGAIVANPVTLGIASVAILGAVTAASIKNKFFPPKEAKQPIAKQSVLEKQVELPQHQKSEHFSDTFDIVHKISLAAHKNEKEILQSDRELYNKKEVQPSEKKFVEPSEIKTEERQDTVEKKPNLHH